jgi:peptidoglycan/LPS O-acetylase OafA/YrhL
MSQSPTGSVAGTAALDAAPAARAVAAAEYFPAFDWLRAALAITVMLAHDGVFTWSGSGAFAVQIFFVLSGWLIGGILLKSSRADLPRFYFNRAVRIWVPYYIALALLVTASLLKEHAGAKWFEFITYKLLMVWNVYGTPQLAEFKMQMPLQGTGNHFWSVNAEEQFYLLSPLLLVLLPKWGRSPLLWFALALVALASQRIYGGILLGVFAAAVVHRYGPVHQARHVPISLAAICVVCAVLLSTGGALHVFGPLFGLAAVLLLAVPGGASRIGQIAGGMSYPLYLNHWIGIFVGNALFAPFGLRESPARVVLASVFSIALAVALYVLVDRRLLAMRGAWYSGRRGRWTMGIAYFMVGTGLVGGAALLLRNGL